MQREAVGLVAGAMRARLQAKIDQLSPGDGPQIQEFLDPFTDVSLDPNAHPAVVVSLAPTPAEVSFRSFAAFEGQLPLAVDYVTRDADSPVARGSVSVVLRAILHVLDELIQEGAEAGGVALLEFQDAVADFITEDGDNVGAAVLFTARTRDTSV